MEYSLNQNVPAKPSCDNTLTGTVVFQHNLPDTKDLGRVILGGGYASVSAPANPPVARRR